MGDNKQPKDRDEEQIGYLLREVQINRYRDILLFIPFLGVVIFLSPILDLAPSGFRIFSVSARFALFFLFWMALVLALRWVNRQMLKRLNERNL